MLTEDQKKKLAQFVGELSPQQLAWVAGYLTHKAEALTGGPVAVSSAALAAAETDSGARRVLIYYATETNNSRGVAETLAAALKKNGFQPRMVNQVCSAFFITAQHATRCGQERAGQARDASPVRACR